MLLYISPVGGNAHKGGISLWLLAARAVAENRGVLMKRNGLKIVLGLVLVFGFGLVFTGCDMENDVEIQFTNNDSVTRRVHIQRANDMGGLAHTFTRDVPPGDSISRVDVAGSFRVRVGTSSADTTFRYPLTGNANDFTSMSGTVRLRFDGDRIMRN